MTSSLPGLRERKKAKTRAAIREAGMTLFEQQGFAATTVEQIAEVAEVSPSTFFRYFPTKEDVVLADDWDAPMVTAIREQPPELSPADALISGLRSMVAALTPDDWNAERRRQRLFQNVPELRARYLQQVTASIDLFASVLAERAGKPEPDLECRAIAGAMIGIGMAIQTGQSGMVDPSDVERYDEAITLLRRSLCGPA
jgi:AcrR family transcriptional regulator